MPARRVERNSRPRDVHALPLQRYGLQSAQASASPARRPFVHAVARQPGGGINALAQHSGYAVRTASGSTPAAGGAGSGAALRINFSETAMSADALTTLPTNANLVEFNRGRIAKLPSVPTIGA